MNHYRVDIVTENPGTEPPASGYFDARTDDAAFTKTLRPHITDPATQYGHPL